ncbi:MAG: flagellar protein FlbB [Spirochaetaceae bacterium]|nr:flagellar protein FlbB [Spirochaetaceae bacterium]
MARRRRHNNIGKTIILLFLIIILILAGLVWFDYLSVIQVKSVFAPVYRLFGLQTQTSTSATGTAPLEADLDNDRFQKRLESLTLKEEELNQRETQLAQAEALNQQTAQELENRRVAQEEREIAFNSTVSQYDGRQLNIVTNVQNLNNMPPQNAVDILVAMDDQDVIDILRMADQIAEEAGSVSLASTWLMMMPADRAAQVQRKMLSKPMATTASAEE